MLLVKNANYNGNGVDILSLDGTITMIKENIENYYGIEEIDLKSFFKPYRWPRTRDWWRRRDGSYLARSRDKV